MGEQLALDGFGGFGGGVGVRNQAGEGDVHGGLLGNTRYKTSNTECKMKSVRGWIGDYGFIRVIGVICGSTDLGFVGGVLPEEVGRALEGGVGESGDDPFEGVGDVGGEGGSAALEEVVLDLGHDESLVGGGQVVDGGDSVLRVKELFGRDADVVEGGGEAFVVEVVGGGESFHAGFLEEGVELAHGGGGFDEEGSGEGEGFFDEFDGEGAGSELGVDDDSGDGSDFAVDQSGAGGGVGDGGVSVVGGEVPQVAVEGWHGVDDDSDESFGGDGAVAVGLDV